MWEVEAIALRAALWGASGAGVLLVVYSTFLTDDFDLFGLRQVWLHARGRPYAPVQFNERGLYRYMRHPMMLGILLSFWATPTMSVGHLVFAAGMSVYALIGVMLEERDLQREVAHRHHRRPAGHPSHDGAARAATDGRRPEGSRAAAVHDRPVRPVRRRAA